MTYTPYQYQPYSGYNPVPSFSPQNYAPPPIQAPPAPQPAQTNGQPGYLCRPVTSRLEAEAVQVDFLGPGTVMPDLAHGMVYIKRFNPNTGSSDFLPFALQAQTTDQQKETTAFAPLQDVMDLQNTVKKLSEEVERLKKPTIGKTVKRNDADE